eukprot:SAG11_NODE_26080_length_350_cov_0.621514_2_plen_22_part_01
MNWATFIYGTNLYIIRTERVDT